MLALRKPALVIKYIYFTRKAFTESFEGFFFLILTQIKMKLSFSIRVRNISPVSQLPQFLNPLKSFTVIIKSSFKYFRFYMVHQVATRKAKSHVLKEKENRIEILSNVLKFCITI